MDPALKKAASAWERFASGEDVVEGVRPEIVESWRRSRDDFRIDPGRDRADASQAPRLPPEESVVAAELCAMAMAIADGEGRILGAWGDSRTLGRASGQNLDPLFVWREETIGTTGVGTALQADRHLAPSRVSRFENWCEPAARLELRGGGRPRSVARSPGRRDRCLRVRPAASAGRARHRRWAAALRRPNPRGARARAEISTAPHRGLGVTGGAADDVGSG